jgi:hypothetical protein
MRFLLRTLETGERYARSVTITWFTRLRPHNPSVVSAVYVALTKEE